VRKRADMSGRCFPGKSHTQSRVHHILKRSMRSNALSPGGHRRAGPARLNRKPSLSGTVRTFCPHDQESVSYGFDNMIEPKIVRCHRAKSVVKIAKSTFILKSSRASTPFFVLDAAYGSLKGNSL